MSHAMRTALLTLLAICAPAAAQQTPLPIIDMHGHALRASSQGPPPLTRCAIEEGFPTTESGRTWPRDFGAAMADTTCPGAIPSPLTDAELMERTLAALEERNVFAVTSGPLVGDWREAGGGRIIPGLQLGLGPDAPPLDSLRAWFTTGRFRVLGEVTIQYRGISPSDSVFDPYLALAEELDVPVGIHIGTGPPGAPYLGFSAYRARLHSPLVLEEALVRHPGLRVYVMHAGWPMLDDLLALLWTYPQVYVGVGLISWGIPRAEFHRYLRRIVEAGFGKRVMFGSDAMVWPDAIDAAIQSIETADFLSEEQKRDILYDNAARFLRLTSEEVARHHGASQDPDPLG